MHTTLAVRTGPLVIRWLARLLSLLAVGLVLVIVMGERPNVLAVIRSTHGTFLLFPFGVCAGLLLAWRWELVGGTISLLCWIAFYMAEFLQVGRLPRGPCFPAFVLPAGMFLASWVWRRKLSDQTAGTRRPSAGPRDLEPKR